MPFYVVKTPNDFWEATAFSSSRKLARSSTGVLWCCYSGPTAWPANHQVRVAYSSDNGVTWTEEVITVVANDDEYPSIAIDSADNIHIVWRHNGGIGDRNIHYRRRTAGGWDAIENVTAVAQVQSAPSVAIDSADNIHVTWIGLGWGGNPLIRNVQYRQRSAAGVWGVQEGITDIGGGFHQWGASQSIFIDAADIVHVAWEGEGWGANPAVNNIQYRQRVAGVWGVQEGVSDSTRWHHFPCIVIDSTGVIHMGYYRYNALANVWEIWYIRRVAGIWQVPEQLAAVAANDQFQPSIAIDTVDNVHLVWYGTGWGANPANFNIQYLKRTAGVWGAQVGLSDRAFDQYFPGLVWAYHPLGGGQPNVLDNYLFVFTGQNDAVGERVEFYTPTVPAAPIPFVINKAYALAREEL